MIYKFKELTVEDLDELINEYINYYNGEGDRWTYDLAKKRLEQIFLTPWFYGIRLYNESVCVGFAVGWFKEFDNIKLFYLEEILVFKEYQNKGFGTKILQELESQVKEQGAKMISLFTTSLEEHQRFYSRLGFEKSDFLIPMFKKI